MEHTCFVFGRLPKSHAISELRPPCLPHSDLPRPPPAPPQGVEAVSVDLEAGRATVRAGAAAPGPAALTAAVLAAIAQCGFTGTAV